MATCFPVVENLGGGLGSLQIHFRHPLRRGDTVGLDCPSTEPQRVSAWGLTDPDGI